jgi:hypothetical protein
MKNLALLGVLIFSVSSFAFTSKYSRFKRHMKKNYGITTEISTAYQPTLEEIDFLVDVAEQCISTFAIENNIHKKTMEIKTIILQNEEPDDAFDYYAFSGELQIAQYYNIYAANAADIVAERCVEFLEHTY